MTKRFFLLEENSCKTRMSVEVVFLNVVVKRLVTFSLATHFQIQFLRMFALKNCFFKDVLYHQPKIKWFSLVPFPYVSRMWFEWPRLSIPVWSLLVNSLNSWRICLQSSFLMNFLFQKSMFRFILCTWVEPSRKDLLHRLVNHPTFCHLHQCFYVTKRKLLFFFLFSKLFYLVKCLLNVFLFFYAKFIFRQFWV